MPSAELIVFAKEPVPGQVKTRLARVVGDDGACELYAAFVSDAVARLSRLDGFAVTLAADPGPDAPFLGALAQRHRVRIVAQGTGDLGERMAAALADRMRATGQAALLIGTDLPTLPTDHLYAALTALNGGQHDPRQADAVFCPAADGGYYLVGTAPHTLSRWEQLVSKLFTNIPWSHPSTLQTTLARAQAAPDPIAVALGPSWYDVDEPADLDRLCRHLKRQSDPPLPDTRSILTRWGRL